MSGGPTLAHSREELAGVLAPARRDGLRVGYVPTMGALHAGHVSLVREARRQVGAEGRVVVSIFVNPLQFAPGEDLDRYPRTLGADLDLLADEGVDVVFAPGPDEVFPGGVRAGGTDEQVTVAPGPLAEVLEGRSRPTHFRGVLTVVAKLFGLVRPDVAVFGEKDYQQLVLIRQMARDLCLGVDVVGAPTVREPDGLALSSRNRFLDAGQREAAGALSLALRDAVDAAPRGPEAALEAARSRLSQASGIELDYLELRAADLGPLPAHTSADAPHVQARILVAARVGSTRLIDNMPLTLGAARSAALASEGV